MRLISCMYMRSRFSTFDRQRRLQRRWRNHGSHHDDVQQDTGTSITFNYWFHHRNASDVICGKMLIKGKISLTLIRRRAYSTGFKLIEKINATASQPQRNVLKYFAVFKNVAHGLEPGETPSYSTSHQAPNYTVKNYTDLTQVLVLTLHWIWCYVLPNTIFSTI